MSSHMVVVYSLLLMCGIILYEYTIIYLSILPLMDIWVVFDRLHLAITNRATMTFLYMSFAEHIYAF